MVQVRAHQPVNTDGSINLEAWLDHVQTLVPVLGRKVLLEACEFAREVEDRAVSTADNSWADGTSSFQTGLEIAEILAIALVRLRAPKSSGISADGGESSLHNSPDQSGGDTSEIAEETP